MSFNAITWSYAFHVDEVRYFAEKELGINDSSYEVGKNEANTQPPTEGFFTSICNTITKRIDEAKEIADEIGSECALSFLIVSLHVANVSIKQHIQTKKGGK